MRRITLLIMTNTFSEDNFHTKELRNCPFCDDGAEVEETSDIRGHIWYRIRCSNRYCKVRPMTKINTRLEIVIKDWNRRAKDETD